MSAEDGIESDIKQLVQYLSVFYNEPVDAKLLANIITTRALESNPQEDKEGGREFTLNTGTLPENVQKGINAVLHNMLGRSFDGVIIAQDADHEWKIKVMSDASLSKEDAHRQFTHLLLPLQEGFQDINHKMVSSGILSRRLRQLADKVPAAMSQNIWVGPVDANEIFAERCGLKPENVDDPLWKILGKAFVSNQNKQAIGKDGHYHKGLRLNYEEDGKVFRSVVGALPVIQDVMDEVTSKIAPELPLLNASSGRGR